MRALHNILRSAGVTNLFYGKDILVYILFNGFKAIGSSDKGSSKTQPGYVTCEYCLFLYLYFLHLVFLHFGFYTYLKKQ